MKSREHVVTNGRAVFYAALWNDFRQAALDKGWALALHGSLASDMDIMAMPWIEGASSSAEMVKALENCFAHPDDAIVFPTKKCYDNPNNRVIYTIHIWSDFYIDLNVIEL